MYCHICGSKAHGNFCYKCGAKLIAVDSNQEVIPQDLSNEIQDWSNEIRYDVLLRVPEVRNLIAQHASQQQKHLSAEQFIELCDKAVAPLVGVSLGNIGAIVQPIYANLGIKTGKTRNEFFPLPTGKTLVAAICSLARRGQPVSKVEQGADGCLLRAGIPSDMWTFGGDFIVTIKRQQQGSSVEAATVIKGQLFDWGKSNRVLAELFEDIKGWPV